MLSITSPRTVKVGETIKSMKPVRKKSGFNTQLKTRLGSIGRETNFLNKDQLLKENDKVSTIQTFSLHTFLSSERNLSNKLALLQYATRQISEVKKNLILETLLNVNFSF